MIQNILLALAIVIGLARLIGEIFERLGLDSIIGEMMTGLLLGPSILNLIGSEIIEPFAMIGVVLILFLAGLKEENAVDIFTDKRAIAIGVFTLLFAGLCTTIYLISPARGDFNLMQIIFFALAFGMVDLGVPAKVLISKNLLGTKDGQTILNSAVVNIIIGLGSLTIITLLCNKDITSFANKQIGVGIFIASCLMLYYCATHLSKYMVLLRVEEAQFSIILIIVMILAYFTDVLGFSNILGAFIAGVIVSKTHYAETRAFSDKLKAISFGLFIPIFFVWFGMELNLHSIIKHMHIAIIFFLISTISKFFIAYVISKKSKINNPGLLASSLLSLDVESMVILLLGLKIGIFDSLPFNPLDVFSPSVPLTTITILILVNIFGRKNQNNSIPIGQ